jgi:hypothetical protein
MWFRSVVLHEFNEPYISQTDHKDKFIIPDTVLTQSSKTACSGFYPFIITRFNTNVLTSCDCFQWVSMRPFGWQVSSPTLLLLCMLHSSLAISVFLQVRSPFFMLYEGSPIVSSTYYPYFIKKTLKPNTYFTMKIGSDADIHDIL